MTNFPAALPIQKMTYWLIHRSQAEHAVDTFWQWTPHLIIVPRVKPMVTTRQRTVSWNGVVVLMDACLIATLLWWLTKPARCILRTWLCRVLKLAIVQPAILFLQGTKLTQVVRTCLGCSSNAHPCIMADYVLSVMMGIIRRIINATSAQDSCTGYCLVSMPSCSSCLWSIHLRYPAVLQGYWKSARCISKQHWCLFKCHA